MNLKPWQLIVVYSYKEGIVKLQKNNGHIYYRGNHIWYDTSIINYWIERDQIFKSGISKIYRRGFLDVYTKKLWRTEFKDILAS